MYTKENGWTVVHMAMARTYTPMAQGMRAIVWMTSNTERVSKHGQTVLATKVCTHMVKRRGAASSIGRMAAATMVSSWRTSFTARGGMRGLRGTVLADNGARTRCTG